MNEPDGRERQNHDSAAPSVLFGGHAQPRRAVEFAISAGPRADASSDPREALSEVWEYLGKH